MDWFHCWLYEETYNRRDLTSLLTNLLIILECSLPFDSYPASSLRFICTPLSPEDLPFTMKQQSRYCRWSHIPKRLHFTFNQFCEFSCCSFPSLPLLSLLVAHQPSLKDSPLTVKQQSLYCIPPSLSGPFFHNVHKSAGKMTLKSSEKINRISICYYLSQLGSLPTLVSNKLTN